VSSGSPTTSTKSRNLGEAGSVQPARSAVQSASTAKKRRHVREELDGNGEHDDPYRPSVLVGAYFGHRDR